MKQKIAIIGGGSAGLFCAAKLDGSKYDVSLFEKNNTIGRKFLVAGDGGLNLSHSEPLEKFSKRYVPQYFLESAIKKFPADDFRKWLNSISIQTFIGSSKRIFPLQSTKPIEVLNAIKEKINSNQIKVFTNHKWVGEDGKSLIFECQNNLKSERFDIVIYALGGASWPVTGSDGKWKSRFESKGITCSNFESSNATFLIQWPKNYSATLEGKVLKNCVFSSESFKQLGEAVFTKTGIEGSGVYPLSASIRNKLRDKNLAFIEIDLKPEISLNDLIQKLSTKHASSNTEFLEKKLNIDKTKIKLLKLFISKERFLKEELLANSIKSLKIPIIGLGPTKDAISTVGGINLNEVDGNFELLKHRNQFCIGEMLDWDAPTGGYLLQACYSMASQLADYLNSKID